MPRNRDGCTRRDGTVRAEPGASASTRLTRREADHGRCRGALPARERGAVACMTRLRHYLARERQKKIKIRTVVQGTIDFFFLAPVRSVFGRWRGGEGLSVIRTSTDRHTHVLRSEAMPVLFLPKGQFLLLTITEPALSLTLGDASNHFI